MHSFSPHRHRSAGEASDKETKGLIGSGGWRSELHGWLTDIFVFRGKVRELRQKTVNLAQLQPGEQVLDVGCGTGTLAIKVARRVGRVGHVAGIDPGAQQIAYARAQAARHNISIDFQIGVIEQLPFPDQTFDVVFSTLMMHHLPAPLKRQGLAEIARVLKPGGRLVIADFKHGSDRQGQAARFHAVNARVILRPNNFDPPVIFFPTLTRSKILTPSFSHTAVRCGSPTLRQVVSTWTCCGGRLAPRRANEGYTAEPLRALVSSAKPTTAIQVVRPAAPTASTRSLRMPTEQGHSALDSQKPTTVRQHKIDSPFIFDPHRQIRHGDLSCGSCDH